jgi:hypothetical protein
MAKKEQVIEEINTILNSNIDSEDMAKAILNHLTENIKMLPPTVYLPLLGTYDCGWED